MSATGAVTEPLARRRLRPWHIVLLVIGLLALSAALYATTRAKATVAVTHPTFEDIETTVSTTGSVVPEHDFPARANFSGLVEKIDVQLGQQVRPGQMLVAMKDQYAIPRLDNAEAALEQAEVSEQNVLNNGSQEDRIGFTADLVKAQTEQKQAQENYNTVTELVKRGSVSNAEVEAARQRLDAANAALTSLQQRMTHRYSPDDIASWKARIAAEKASLAAERVSYANANISSPIAGTVYLLGVRPYDFVPAGTDLLHVADLTHLEVRADFDQPDLGKLRLGEPVRITWDGAPGRTWHGRLLTKPLAVTRSGPRTVGECTISLDDDHGDLPVNTNVAVIVATERRSHVLAIPREALKTEGRDHVAYRVVDDRLVRTPVETGLANAMNIEIREGLHPGDEIALHANGDEKLRNDMRVKTKQD